MQPLDAPFAVQYVAVPKTDSGTIVELYKDGSYFGRVYHSLAMRYPHVKMWEHNTDLHLVVSFDNGEQLSVMVAPDKLAEQVDLIGRLKLVPF